jgi:hypothetical protein
MDGMESDEVVACMCVRVCELPRKGIWIIGIFDAFAPFAPFDPVSCSTSHGQIEPEPETETEPELFWLVDCGLAVMIYESSGAHSVE